MLTPIQSLLSAIITGIIVHFLTIHFEIIDKNVVNIENFNNVENVIKDDNFPFKDMKCRVNNPLNETLLNRLQNDTETIITRNHVQNDIEPVFVNNHMDTVNSENKPNNNKNDKLVLKISREVPHSLLLPTSPANTLNTDLLDAIFVTHGIPINSSIPFESVEFEPKRILFLDELNYELLHTGDWLILA